MQGSQNGAMSSSLELTELTAVTPLDGSVSSDLQLSLRMFRNLFIVMSNVTISSTSIQAVCGKAERIEKYF